MQTGEQGEQDTAGARVGRRMDDFVSGMKDRARDFKDKYISDGWTQTRDYIKENPGKSILIAAAAGVLLGALLTRRRR